MKCSEILKYIKLLGGQSNWIFLFILLSNESNVSLLYERAIIDHVLVLLKCSRRTWNSTNFAETRHYLL